MDPAGIQLTFRSSEWCDPTLHAGYTLTKEPTSGTRQSKSRMIDRRNHFSFLFFFFKANQTEREECVTFNIGTSGNSFLCLADDYCNEKYPFICEMNAASMKLANSVLHGEHCERKNQSD